MDIGALRSQIELEPARLDCRLQLIEELRKKGSLGEAETELQNIVDLAPLRHEIRFDLAKLQYDCRHLVDCLSNTRKLIKTLRNESAVWLIHGMALSQLSTQEQAEEAFRRALKLDDKNALCLINLGNALHLQEKYSEAVEVFEQGLELEPENLSLLQAVSSASLQDQQYDYAIETLNKLIGMGVDDLNIRKNLALCYHRTMRGAEAEKWYLAAQQLSPSDPAAHYSLGMVYLAQGKYLEGWPEYEHRWDADLPMTQLPQTSIPRWQGEDLKGKRILITGEQGVGDNIQFCRFINKLKTIAEPDHIAYMAPQEFAHLFEGLKDLDKLIEGRSLANEHYDYYSPLLSLMALLKLEVSDIDYHSPYLSPPAHLAAQWQEWLDKRCKKQRPKIGISWTGSSGNVGNSIRSFPLEILKPLFEFEAVQWVSLQFEGEEELQKLELNENHMPLQPMHPINGKVKFSDTAAIIKSLDLLITVDTSVAHMAGALDIPVWTILTRSGDWRYFYEGDTVPWYPTMRLFRNTDYRDWTPMADMLFKALKVDF